VSCAARGTVTASAANSVSAMMRIHVLEFMFFSSCFSVRPH
jgi:hypothetical protein